MGQLKDLTGQRFGKLTVIEFVELSKHGNAVWKCQCICGNTTIVSSNSLLTGHTKSCDCTRKEIRNDLTGQKFGRLTVTKLIGSENSQTMWECLCLCGNISIVASGSLVSGSTKSCGCSKGNWKNNTESAANSLFSNNKSSAAKRNLEFSLTKEQFLEITKRNCDYCGIEPLQIAKCKGGTNGDYIYNGLDRVDNEKGYTIENCVSCCKQCNISKASYTKEKFINWAKRLVKNLENK